TLTSSRPPLSSCSKRPSSPPRWARRAGAASSSTIRSTSWHGGSKSCTTSSSPRRRPDPMLTLAAVVFWTCLGLIAYVYAGYPILLFLLGSLRRAQPRLKPAGPPRVSLIISAYNEEDVIREKIANSLNLEYP